MTYGLQKTGVLSVKSATEVMVPGESWDSVKETGGSSWLTACEWRGGCCKGCDIPEGVIGVRAITGAQSTLEMSVQEPLCTERGWR